MPQEKTRVMATELKDTLVARPAIPPKARAIRLHKAIRLPKMMPAMPLKELTTTHP